MAEDNTIETDLSGDDLNAIFAEAPPSDELGATDMSAGTDGQAPADQSAPAAQGGQGQSTPSSVDAPSTPATTTPPVSQPTTQPQTQTPPAAAAPTTQPTAPESFEAYVTKNYEPLVKALAEGAFKLTDAEAAAMGDAAPVVAQYQARAHLHTMVMVQKAIHNALPDAVAGLVQVSRKSADLESKFFRDYPELKAIESNKLAQLAYGLRQGHPEMPVDQFMPMLARVAAAAASIQLKPVRGQAPAFAPAGQQRGGVNPHPTPRTRVDANGQMGGADQLASINDMLRLN